MLPRTDWRDDKDIKKQFRRQNAVGNMLVRKFSFAPIEAKIQLFKPYCYPIYVLRHLWLGGFRIQPTFDLVRVATGD